MRRAVAALRGYFCQRERLVFWGGIALGCVIGVASLSFYLTLTARPATSSVLVLRFDGGAPAAGPAVRDPGRAVDIHADASHAVGRRSLAGAPI